MVVDIEVLIWRKYGILLDKTLLKAVWPEAGYRNLRNSVCNSYLIRYFLVKKKKKKRLFHSCVIPVCGAWETAPVTPHSCLLIIDHTVREVFVLEVKVGLSGQIICVIMKGQGV